MLISIIPVYIAIRLAGEGALRPTLAGCGGAETRSARGTGRTRRGSCCAPVLAVRRLRVLRQQTATLQLLELRLRGRLLGEHRRLDPVEETLEPADELCLRDPELGLGGHALHRRRQLPSSSRRSGESTSDSSPTARP